MKIALYYRHIEAEAESYLAELTDILHHHGIDTCEVGEDCDFLFSIGGDGTLLSSVQFIRPDSPNAFPPVLGINFGHLGFLTTVGKENLHSMVEELLGGRYSLEERTLL